MLSKIEGGNHRSKSMTKTAEDVEGVEMNHDRGPWSSMASGRRFYVRDPRAGDFDIHDIAHHLSLTNRYGGATPKPYSVAQHSCQCLWYARGRWPGETELHMQMLMHDAAEAYLGDLIKPVKVCLPDFAVLEDLAMRAIACQYGFGYPLDPRVHEVDMILCATEKRDLLPKTEDWPGMPDPMTTKLFPTDYRLAKDLFLLEFERINNEMRLLT